MTSTEAIKIIWNITNICIYTHFENALISLMSGEEQFQQHLYTRIISTASIFTH
jgi:hypothetical protein